jgi:pimeloyl-ACP methyl ester carboxylesterase
MTRASQTLAIAERSCRARPALLLVHGSLASGRMWTPYLGALSTAGELITVDLHGYGASPIVRSRSTSSPTPSAELWRCAGRLRTLSGSRA